MKAVRQLGLRRTIRFAMYAAILPFSRLLIVPAVRAWFMRMLGARVGRDTVCHDVRFVNAYRKGFSGLTIGSSCYFGEECLLDLADEITAEDNVTVSMRAVLLTHLNVGYADHPLQARYRPSTGRLLLRKGCFVGAASVLLPGVEVGEEAFVAAGAVVTKSVPARSMVAGNPARVLHQW